MAFLSGLLLCVSAVSSASAGSEPAATAWDARAVEHLLNRAGFGARPDEIAAGVAKGQAALVSELVDRRVDVEPFFVENLVPPDQRELAGLTPEQRGERQQEFRVKDRTQLNAYTAWWFERLTSGEDPLRERMVLFWHGFFTSSYDDVMRGTLVIRQNQLVREMALGSYASLLQSVIRDPAMLVYLDNNVNRKRNPNENLARELMELFSLGVGNYTEKDVQEAARALTGRGISREGEYEFHVGQHDRGRKTVLGTTGMLDGEGLVALLLKQDACPRHVAGRLITYFEGLPPSPERLAEYAAFLRKNEFEIRPFLRKLFLDPAFYRDEVVAARVASPIDYLVGISHRLGSRVPPGVLAGGAGVLGQRLFFPPSVKGWDEGEPWVTTSTLMQRGNLAGILLGVVRVQDVLSPPAESKTEPASDPKTESAGAPQAENAGGAPPEAAPPAGPAEAREKARAAGPAKGSRRGAAQLVQALRRIDAAGWKPNLNFTARMERAGAKTDAAIADRMLDDLLPIQAPAETRARMRAFLAHERAELGAEDGALLAKGSDAEQILRRLAHLILSLPEAQLG
jgi:uncharacterized protein (DUF1800 family)